MAHKIKSQQKTTLISKYPDRDVSVEKWDKEQPLGMVKNVADSNNTSVPLNGQLAVYKSLIDN